MEFSLFDDGDGDEYNSVSLVETSKISAKQGTFLFGTETYDRA